MSDYVIKVENLSKVYRIGLKEQMHDTLGGAMAGFFRRPLANLRNLRRLTRFTAADSDGADTIWALKDVSFEIAEGEVAGIIGRNGAGKSTLLKIISRITEPTAGQITLRGRVSSLLEVGTGFHPELTGRENVYLNGTILGMTKGEIDVKFDEIVAFAEVERFIDTPVKRYSSGMMVRLAFAVAAHLEPEILVVDEVLAVGDIEFQKKCLGKMDDVARGGRTVLFVSHNMGAVSNLCQTGILLQYGRLAARDDVKNVIQKYLTKASAYSIEYAPKPDRPSIVSIEIDQDSVTRGDLMVKIGFESPFDLTSFNPGLVVHDQMGNRILGTNAKMHSIDSEFKKIKNGMFNLMLRNLPLHSGLYQISVFLGDNSTNYDHKLYALSFEFFARDEVLSKPGIEHIGYLNVIGEWKAEQ